ncbi:hypothetical protein MRX96_035168 [Rhipicephalus microplus]
MTTIHLRSSRTTKALVRVFVEGAARDSAANGFGESAAPFQPKSIASAMDRPWKRTGRREQTFSPGARKVPCLGLTQTEGAVRILPDWLQYQLLKRITTSHRHVPEDAPRGGAAAHIVGYKYRIVGGLVSVRQQLKEATKELKISLQSCSSSEVYVVHGNFTHRRALSKRHPPAGRRSVPR